MRSIFHRSLFNCGIAHFLYILVQFKHQRHYLFKYFKDVCSCILKDCLLLEALGLNWAELLWKRWGDSQETMGSLLHWSSLPSEGHTLQEWTLTHTVRPAGGCSPTKLWHPSSLHGWKGWHQWWHLHQRWHRAVDFHAVVWTHAGHWQGVVRMGNQRLLLGFGKRCWCLSFLDSPGCLRALELCCLWSSYWKHCRWLLCQCSVFIDTENNFIFLWNRTVDQFSVCPCVGALKWHLEIFSWCFEGVEVLLGRLRGLQPLSTALVLPPLHSLPPLLPHSDWVYIR